MSMEKSDVEPQPEGAQPAAKSRVYAIIDGFNLFHAIDKFESGVDAADKARYQKYKWLCLRSLISEYVRPEIEDLVAVHYFTAYPNWNDAKRLRHQTYVSALRARGVEYTLGEFKSKTIECRAICKGEFQKPEEKQTDVNIATKILEVANEYDKLILVTADSDQVPAIKLLKKQHPEKKVFILAPIGRNSKELVRAAEGNRMIMTEAHLLRCQLPNPVDIFRGGKVLAQVWKPASWPTPAPDAVI